MTALWLAAFVSMPYDPARAVPAMKRVMALEPNHGLFVPWGAWALNCAGARAEARQLIDSIARLMPQDPFARFMRGEILLSGGDAAGALVEYTEAAKNGAFYTHGNGGVGRALATLGRRDEARRIAAKLEAERSTRYVSGDFIAGIYVALGDTDAAFKWLDVGVTERSTYLEWFTLNPTWAPLRGDSRYLTVVRRLNLVVHQAFTRRAPPRSTRRGRARVAASRPRVATR